MEHWCYTMAALTGPMVGAVLFSQRFAWWRPAIPYRFPRILMYHMVQPHRQGTRFNGLRVDPAVFQQQLQWLHDHGWSMTTMSDVVGNWKSLPEKTVAITFDDGFRDNFTYAFPLLQKYQARATLYLVRDRFSGDWSVNKKRHHNTNELGAEEKLSDGEVQEMVDSGCFELGSHTLSHPNLAKLSIDEKRTELVRSKQSLENQFGVPVTSFAYPFGIYSPEDPELVREAGYTSAVTTVPGIDATDQPDFFQLRRVKIGGREGMASFRLRMKTGRRAWNK